MSILKRRRCRCLSFILSQPFPDGLAHTAAFRFVHIARRAYKFGLYPNNVLVLLKPRSFHRVLFCKLLDNRAFLFAYAEIHSPSALEIALLVVIAKYYILRHSVLVGLITTDEQILVLHDLDLRPIRRALANMVKPVPLLCDAPFEVLRLCKIKKCDSLFFDIA